MILTENSTVYFLSVPESDVKICLFQIIDHLPSSTQALAIHCNVYLQLRNIPLFLLGIV